MSVIPNGSSNHNNGGDAYDGFKYPHLQLRNVSFDVRRGRKYDRLLDGVTFEVRGGEILAVMATKGKTFLFFSVLIREPPLMTSFFRLR